MSDATGPPDGGSRGFDLDTWIRPLCALAVAGVAAYASYVHQREFALQGGADGVSASLWPLSVDGLLLLATVGLLRPYDPAHAVRGALCGPPFCWGSRCPWRPISRRRLLWSGNRCWPPVALLLSVELLVHRPIDRPSDAVTHLWERSSRAKSDHRQEGEDPATRPPPPTRGTTVKRPDQSSFKRPSP
ncbi:DUF2637 domain-containing protein [Streptomyces sp. NBC_00286]|uniref:DUF2637 domain-containing protein n=1 Tax=Streptomyces sp. NBC_00286 TaxID=2975701 RepID=UPI002E27EAD6|nr:DUF2637 domain-containing protein [Streptomyces sp. NBC_00286]